MQLSNTRKINITADGVAGIETWESLYKSTNAAEYNIPFQGGPKPTIELGDTGPYVADLQQQLKDLLYYNHDINGIFDQDTAVAVKAFQDASRLIADGLVGRITWNALYSVFAPPVLCD